MIREPVKSSNINAIGYDPTSSVLEIEFRTGGIYRYFGVPDTIYRALVTAPSIGAFFQKRIRDTYRCEQVFDDA